MVQDKATCASRRDALKLGPGVGVGIAANAMAASSAFSQPAKLSKESVKYTNAGNIEGKDCDDCSQFVPGKSAEDLGTCKIVEGPINPHGHCIAFSAKPKR